MEREKDNLITNFNFIEEWDFERNEIKPDTLTIGSGRKVWWICSKNKEHRWETRISHRSTSGCPYCAGKKADKDNNFSLFFPNLLKEWDFERNNIYPNEVLSKSHKKVWWICSKNKEHRWEAQISNRTVNGTKCPYCCNQKKDKSNCLAATHPHLMKEWDYEKNKIVPEKVSRGTKMNAWWICSKNPEHKWKADIKNRSIHMSGCPHCATLVSKGHQEVVDYIKSVFSGEMRLNDRQTIFNRKTKRFRELDIYLPEINLAIEYNGNYFHSTKEVKKRDKIKKQLCEEKGIKLITIWENDWKINRDKSINLITSYLLVV